MKPASIARALLLLATGCTTVVAPEDERMPWEPPAIDGMDCRYLHGEATLAAYDGQNPASSAFSFEYGSQDPELTNNDLDVLYERNYFRVNLLTDDRSFIVELGDVPLHDVPGDVDPEDYPRGMFDEHDYIQAQLERTYFVSASDGEGRTLAAFRVIGLEPGVRVSIEWIRSTDPDRLLVPVGCGL